MKARECPYYHKKEVWLEWISIPFPHAQVTGQRPGVTFRKQPSSPCVENRTQATL